METPFFLCFFLCFFLYSFFCVYLLFFGSLHIIAASTLAVGGIVHTRRATYEELNYLAAVFSACAFFV